MTRLPLMFLIALSILQGCSSQPESVHRSETPAAPLVAADPTDIPTRTVQEQVQWAREHWHLVTSEFDDAVSLLSPDERKELRGVAGPVLDEGDYQPFSTYVSFDDTGRTIKVSGVGMYWVAVSGHVALLTSLSPRGSFFWDYGLHVRRCLKHGDPVPNPARAAGWPKSAFTSQELAGVEIATRNTLFFLLAHEIGHIRHRHELGMGTTGSRAQELEADQFAFELCRRRAVRDHGFLPSSVLVLLTISGLAFEDQDVAMNTSTHPPGFDRIGALATRFKESAAALDPTNSRSVLSLASSLAELGEAYKADRAGCIADINSDAEQFTLDRLRLPPRSP